MAVNTRNRWPIWLSIYGIICFVLLCFPHHGPPNFRYTGSDPIFSVWNFGWPVATMIWDPRLGLQVGQFNLLPFAALFGLGIAGLVLAWVRAWVRDNHRVHLTGGSRE